MIILDCTNTPGNPEFVVNAPNTYSHDVYTRDNKMYSSEINDGVFSIYDVTNKSNITLLGNQETPFAFTHNAWLSDDGNTLFTTDELANAPVGSYDVSDPSDIQFLDAYAPFATLGDGVIPHNVHVWQNWLIVSYYTDGCIILDATYPDNLVEVGNFDTYIPPTTGFQGVWGAYPFLPSGLILCTDIGNGLFVLEPNYVQACYLHGDVTDALSGAAIPSAEVKLLTTATFDLTDVAGEFKTGIATSGTYDIEVSKPGYQTAMATAEMVNGEVTTISVELTPLPSFAFTGVVVEAGTGDPIENAVVNMANDNFNFDVTTDVSGNFNIPTFYEDSYEVFAGKWGYRTNYLAAQSFDENNNTITIELEKGYEDVFALDLGWNQSGNGGIFGVSWELGEPIGLQIGPGIFISPDEDVDDIGSGCYVTGNSPNVPESLLLEGNAVLTSPSFDLTGYNQPMISYNFWYLNALDGNPPTSGNDDLRARLNNGNQTVTIGTHEMESIFDLGWIFSTEIKIDSLIEPTDNMTFTLVANASNNAATEAALDDWRVWDADPTPPVGVNDPLDQTIQLSVYPNPSSSAFRLNYDLTSGNEQSALRVLNALGQQVEVVALEGSRGILSFGHELPTGIYFAQIQESNRSSRVIKLIKE